MVTLVKGRGGGGVKAILLVGPIPQKLDASQAKNILCGVVNSSAIGLVLAKNY